jgi:type I restriction enzyme R subunit
MKRTSEAAFETAIESVLLGEGYTPLDGTGFDRERAIFPD